MSEELIKRLRFMGDSANGSADHRTIREAADALEALSRPAPAVQVPEGGPLRKLGKRLAELLDEDQFAECEALLLAAAPAPATVPDDMDAAVQVPEGWKFIRNPKAAPFKELFIHGPEGQKFVVSNVSTGEGLLLYKLAEALLASPAPVGGCAVPELDDEVRWILGRPNFACADIARLLRKTGQKVEKRAEDEQAVAIHWMLSMYMKHGADWRTHGDAELAAIAKQSEVGRG